MWICREGFRFRVTPGFLLLLAGLLYLDEGVGLVPWALLACVVHELGHVIAGWTVKGRIQSLSLSIVGAELAFEYPVPLSYRREILVAMAGPAANLLAGLAAYGMQFYVLAVFSFGIGAFNLLPIRPLDGGTVLSDLLAGLLGPDWSEHILLVLSGVLVGALVGIGAVAALHYANLTLILTAIWLLANVLRQYQTKKT